MRSNINTPQILVLDFGSQYTQLIARRLREYGIYTEIVPYFEKIDSIKAKNPKGIILSGGPASIYEEGAYKPDSKIFDLAIPILGICYGMQYIAHYFGGQVVRAQAQEFGRAVLEILNTNAAKQLQFPENGIVQTARCFLREYTQNDIESLYAIAGNKETMEALGRTYTKEECREWIEKQNASYTQNGFGIWAVIEQSSGKIIGSAGIEKTTIMLHGREEEVFELGYLLDKEYWQKGYGLEVTEACKDYAFCTLYVSALYCSICKKNESSQKLIQKLGAIHVGTNETKEGEQIWILPNKQQKCDNFKLVGQDIYLRELRESDFSDIASMLHDIEVMNAWGRTLNGDETKEWVERQFQTYQEYGFGLWAVIEKSSGTIVGQCGITWQEITADTKEDSKKLYDSIMRNIGQEDYLLPEKRHYIQRLLEQKSGFLPELGYMFNKAYWHKGYATQAAKLCMEYAFETLGFPLLISLIKTDNTAPQNVAKRLEMHIVGQTKKEFDSVNMPHFIYILEAKNWQTIAFPQAKQKHIPLEFSILRPTQDSQKLTKEIQQELIKLWEESVHATHHFLRHEDIMDIKDEVAAILPKLTLIIAKDYQKTLGFIGLQSNKIVALFIAPSAFKKGIGKALIKKALESGLGDYEHIVVDCNEANSDAIGFYHALGFAIFKRSPKDEQGRDFPLVHFQIHSTKLMRAFHLNYNMPLFETDRLIVREMNANDKAGLQAMLLDYEVMSSWEYNFNDSNVQEWLHTQLERYKKFGFGLWAVVEKQSGEMIGQAGLSLQRYNDKKVLGMTYIIAKCHWHKGYGAEVALGCKYYAFHALRAKELYLLIKEDNEASKSVAKKLNATLLGDTTWNYRGREMQRLVYRIKNKNAEQFTLETNRTILRPYEDSDYPAIKAMLQDNETMQTWNGALNDGQVQTWIEKEKTNYEKFGIGWWVIIEKTSGNIIGQVGLHYTQYLTLSYMLHKSHWHKGYAIEVAFACKEYAFKYLRAKEIYCICREIDIPAQNVAKRIGMDKTCEIIDDINGARSYEFRAISKISPLAYTKYLYTSSMESLESLHKNLAHLGLKISILHSLNTKEMLDVSALWQEYFKSTHKHLPEEAIEQSGKNMQEILKVCAQCFVISSNTRNIQDDTDSEILAFLVLHKADTQVSFLEIFLCSQKAHMEKEGIALLQAFMHINESATIHIPCLSEQIQKQDFYTHLGFTQLQESALYTRFTDSKDTSTARYTYHDTALPCSIYSIESKNLANTLKSLLLEDSHNYHRDTESVYIAPQNKQKNTHNTILQQSGITLFSQVKQNSVVWMSHADKVETLPSGFVELAKSGNTHYCAIADFTRQIYALQFHPEVVHSECGGEILKNFALGICGADNAWNMKNFAEAEIAKLREKVLGVAQNLGGLEILDSSVACGGESKSAESGGDSIQPDREKLRFCDITEQNYERVCALHISDEDRGFIESNADSIKEAQKSDYWQTKAIYSAGAPVGFVMYGYVPSEDRVWIDRFMIDSAHSGRGLGRRAMQHLIAQLRAKFGREEIYTSVYEANTRALRFYEKLGFVANGERDRNNELVLVCRGGAESTIYRSKPTQKVLCAVSGGVDSSVVATLLYRAIGENLIPVFVDTGLLRKGEREAVEKMFKENLKVPLIVADARELFLGRLQGVIDPEKKRKIIGETFIEVFEREAKKHNTKGEIKFLAQGTLYPDVIESVSVKGPSKTIKSHHNVGGLPEWMKFELIEPLRELFKDEVRALGRELGMPESMLMRHPFPGPGLAIRIMGEVNSADLELLKEADSIFIEELHKWGLYDSVWQGFCVLLNVRSVGVMGDNRTYDNTICVRAVEAMDGMTAGFSHLPHEFLESVSNRIINEVEGINRVVYDITSKPPGTIEWE